MCWTTSGHKIQMGGNLWWLFWRALKTRWRAGDYLSRRWRLRVRCARGLTHGGLRGIVLLQFVLLDAVVVPVGEGRVGGGAKKRQVEGVHEGGRGVATGGGGAAVGDGGVRSLERAGLIVGGDGDAGTSA